MPLSGTHCPGGLHARALAREAHRAVHRITTRLAAAERARRRRQTARLGHAEGTIRICRARQTEHVHVGHTGTIARRVGAIRALDDAARGALDRVEAGDGLGRRERARAAHAAGAAVLDLPIDTVLVDEALVDDAVAVVVEEVAGLGLATDVRLVATAGQRRSDEERREGVVHVMIRSRHGPHLTTTSTDMPGAPSGPRAAPPPPRPERPPCPSRNVFAMRHAATPIGSREMPVNQTPAE
jgi:hypothetical protein